MSIFAVQNMSERNNQSQKPNKQVLFNAYFFLLIGIFMSFGELPQYFELVDSEQVEWMSGFEDDAEEKNKENSKETENDQFNSGLINMNLLGSKAIHEPDGLYHKWQNPSSDIITPPPEFSL